MEKITYAALGNLGEDFHQSFEAAVIHERKKLGAAHPMFIYGKPVKAAKTFSNFNPAHQSLVKAGVVTTSAKPLPRLRMPRPSGRNWAGPRGSTFCARRRN